MLLFHAAACAIASACAASSQAAVARLTAMESDSVAVGAQVPVAAEPQEVDYLEMVYSLAPRVAAASDVGTAGGGEGAEADDHSAAEARISTRADGGGAVMPLTVAWQGDLGSSPRPAVLRAYGAYGLCADVGFHPEDLPLLQRCASHAQQLHLLIPLRTPAGPA